MPVSADTRENPGNCEQVEHFFSVFGTGGLSAINTGVNALLQRLKFVDIEPGDVIRDMSVVSLPSRFLRISQIGEEFKL
jgi:hypothetical protein